MILGCLTKLGLLLIKHWHQINTQYQICKFRNQIKNITQKSELVPTGIKEVKHRQITSWTRLNINLLKINTGLSFAQKRKKQTENQISSDSFSSSGSCLEIFAKPIKEVQ